MRESLPVLTPTRIDTLRDEQGEFFSPGSIWLALTRAGNTVAIDGDDKQLVLFDTTGRALHRIGRKGEGPGEFRSPYGIFVLPGDSIALWDTMLRRMSYFDASLKFDRTEQFQHWGLSGQSRPVGRLSDGRWVALIVAHGPSRYGADEARRVVDTATLVVGHADKVPIEFQRLRHREGVDIYAKAGKYEFRLGNLVVGEGAVCEQGAVLVDAGGVRLLDASGRVVSVSKLPRTGDSIRTAAERSAIAGNQLPDGLDLGGARGEASALLAEMVSGFRVQMLRPAIDVNGQLWYDRHGLPRNPPSVVDQVDSAGQAVVALSIWWLVTGVRIGENSVALLNHGADTTGLTVFVSRYPLRFQREPDGRLGRCFASFEY